MSNIRTYSELITIPTFEGRYEYLRCGGHIGIDTFGWNRFLNQSLYTSDRWKKFRNKIIIRDEGCDLAFYGHDIYQMKNVIVHHLNPITVEDVLNDDPCVFDPENVVCTILKTHNAIHYGTKENLPPEPIVRRPNDTAPWRN